MKKLLIISAALLLSGCVAFPAYDGGYYYPDYGTYPYGYGGANVNIFFSDFHGGRGFHKDGNAFRDGRHDFHNNGQTYNSSGRNYHDGGQRFHNGGRNFRGGSHMTTGRR